MDSRYGSASVESPQLFLQQSLNRVSTIQNLEEPGAQELLDLTIRYSHNSISNGCHALFGNVASELSRPLTPVTPAVNTGLSFPPYVFQGPPSARGAADGVSRNCGFLCDLPTLSATAHEGTSICDSWVAMLGNMIDLKNPNPPVQMPGFCDLTVQRYQSGVNGAERVKYTMEDSEDSYHQVEKIWQNSDISKNSPKLMIKREETGPFMVVIPEGIFGAKTTLFFTQLFFSWNWGLSQGRREL